MKMIVAIHSIDTKWKIHTTLLNCEATSMNTEKKIWKVCEFGFIFLIFLSFLIDTHTFLIGLNNYEKRRNSILKSHPILFYLLTYKFRCV